ncbi:MAG: MlaD family protein [Thioalkalivibrionaceae bacterium]
MSDTRHFRLGLFVLGAIVSLVALLVLMGVGTLFRPALQMETYIDASVQGLEVGAPVKFRGVTIGDVTHIGFTSSVYQLDAPPTERRRYVMVEARIRPDRFVTPGRETLIHQETIERLVQSGLRVRMAAQGITGINYLEIDFMSEDPPTVAVDWTPNSLYIPSAPSIAVQFLEYAENVLRRVDSLDIEGVVNGLSSVLASLDKSIQGLDTTELNQNLNATLTELTRTLEGVEQATAGLTRIVNDPALRALPEEARATLASTRRMLEGLDLDGLTEQLEALVGNANRSINASETQLEAILSEVRGASAAVRGLTEDLRRDPSRVFRAPQPGRSLLDDPTAQ